MDKPHILETCVPVEELVSLDGRDSSYVTYPFEDVRFCAVELCPHYRADSPLTLQYSVTLCRRCHFVRCS